MADTKLAQTAINLLRDRVARPVVQADAVASKIRQAIIDNNLTGQFTTAELNALQAFVTDLAALADSPVVAALETRYVPSHRAKALIIDGVNNG